jgi:hypothetical protein
VNHQTSKRALQTNVLALPYSEGLSPTSLALPDKLTADQWLEVGRALGRARSAVMWWVGDWWARGEHQYGDRVAIVKSDDWEGPAFQTSMDAAWVCRKFETSRRREALPFSSHKEIAALPDEWQDEVLTWAEIGDDGAPRTRQQIRDRVKQVRAFLAQGWTPDQLERKAQAEAGKCVVANMRDGGDGQRTDEALLAWAEAESRFVQIDRKTEWGNPFEIPDDGDRPTVCAKFAKHYFPQKDKLLSRTPTLRGKVIVCWCHPEECHGHLIAEVVNREAAGEGTATKIADTIADFDG